MSLAIPLYMQQKLLDHYKHVQDEYGQGVLPGPDYVGMQAIGVGFTTQLMQERLAESDKPAITTPLPSAGLPESPIEIWQWDSHLSTNQLRCSSETGPYYPINDQRVDGCYQILQQVDKFFRETLNIYPVQTADKRMVVHLADPNTYNNACWNPTKQQVFVGDVDKRFFKPFELDVSIMTHEYGHAATMYSSNLFYADQSGALNESMSDIFAAAHNHYLAQIPANDANAVWDIGRDLLVSGGTALRSMDNPGTAYDHPILGKDPQVGHMNDYVALPLSNDNGGVHIYSGIPNKAFCVSAKEVAGNSWEKPLQIWQATRNQAASKSTFSDFAKLSLQVARGQFPECEQAIGKGWTTVGVDLR